MLLRNLIFTGGNDLYFIDMIKLRFEPYKETKGFNHLFQYYLRNQIKSGPPNFHLL